MKNRTGRQWLEQRYGKGCFMERAGIRVIPTEEEAKLKKRIKGFKKLDRRITYHHIKEKQHGGEVSIENGANLAFYNHEWLTRQPQEVKDEINQKLQDFKYAIDMARISIGDNGLEFEKLNINIDLSDTFTIPVYDNSLLSEKEKSRIKFNRAHEKNETKLRIKEEIEDLDRG